MCGLNPWSQGSTCSSDCLELKTVLTTITCRYTARKASEGNKLSVPTYGDHVRAGHLHQLEILTLVSFQEGNVGFYQIASQVRLLWAACCQGKGSRSLQHWPNIIIKNKNKNVRLPGVEGCFQMSQVDLSDAFTSQDSGRWKGLTELAKQCILEDINASF